MKRQRRKTKLDISCSGVLVLAIFTYYIGKHRYERLNRSAVADVQLQLQLQRRPRDDDLLEWGVELLLVLLLSLIHI